MLKKIASLSMLVILMLGFQNCSQLSSVVGESSGGSIDSIENQISFAQFNTVIEKNCNHCHGAQGSDFTGILDFTTLRNAQEWMDHPKRLIVEGSPSQSSVYNRLIHAEDIPEGIAKNMPFATADFPVTFSKLDSEIIRDFIIGLGAGNGGVIPQIDDFSTPESTLAKVKYLLSGDAVLASEIDQVMEVDGSLKADAFKTLVGSWIDQPRAQSKLQTFFELSMYQDSWEYPEDGTLLLGTIRPQGTGNNQNRYRTAWTKNLQESYAKTVMKILDDGKPFNDIITSSERMVTSAILSTLRYVDTANEGEGIELTDLTFNNHLRGLQASDFEDWRLVDLQSGGNGPLFSNMNAIRNIADGGSIQLKIPRPGFFNTLGFQFRFPTNDANDFRSLASETLVVATNRIFEAGDQTVEGDLSALDDAHAGPDTACYLCHRLLDPIRETFKTQYDLFYRFNPEGTVNKSEFAFQDHKGRSEDLPEFALTLSQHPLFSVGWTGKL